MGKILQFGCILQLAKSIWSPFWSLKGDSVEHDEKSSLPGESHNEHDEKLLMPGESHNEHDEKLLMPGESHNEHDEKLLMLGESHNEFRHQIWGQSNKQFVFKCTETAWPIRGQETQTFS